MNHTLEMQFGEWAKEHWPVIGNASEPDRCPLFSEQDVDRYALRAFYAGAVTRCPDLQGIYGADIYKTGAERALHEEVSGLRTENATLRRRVKAYAAVALLGWIALVVMGVVL